MNEQQQSILIVDDNPVNIQILHKILTQTYTIFFATTGLDSLDIAAQENPDLILLDIMMPEMDGYEVCQRLKANPHTCDIPVIFVTAMTEMADEKKGLELGAVDYITKPVSPPIVKARLKSHLKLVAKTKEIKKAYGELKASQSQLLQQEKMASIGQLAAGVAHEINNPTSFVASNLGTLHKYLLDLQEFINFQSQLIGLLKNAKIKTAQQKQWQKLDLDFILDDGLELIEESLHGIERVRKIVQDLKSFSRVDQAEYNEIDIHECLDTTLNIIWHELKDKARVSKDYGKVSAITCYPQQLNQVFVNLLLNAAQSMDGKGTITIRTREKNNMLCISIADTGAGIPEENLGHLFEPFFTTRDVGRGTGLGLSIAYDIVKKHGGELSVESELGQGATFTIKLPIQ